MSFFKSKFYLLLRGILFCFFVSASATDTEVTIDAFQVPDLKDNEHYTGTKGFFLHQRLVRNHYDIKRKPNINFTFFSAGEIAPTDNSIIFSVQANQTALLNWGNADGKQPPEQQVLFPEEECNIVLNIKQNSPGKSSLEMFYTRYGEKLGFQRENSVKNELIGNKWQELKFKQPGYYYGAPADGLIFKITNTQNVPVVYEIEWINLEQMKYEAYIRHEFEIPPGKILHAVAEVTGKNRLRWYRRETIKQELWINGKKVEQTGNLQYLHTSSVDIKPYLKPGKNVIGMYGYGIEQNPLLFFHAVIDQPQGRTEVQTEKNWKFSETEQEGWSKTGFDDSSWQTVKTLKNSEAPWLARSPDYSVPNFDGTLAMPSWLGYIQLHNGNGKHELTFIDNKDTIIDAVIPLFLKDKVAYAEFSLHQTTPEGKISLSVAAKRIPNPTESKAGTALVFRLNLGKLKAGVYTLSSRICNAENKVIEVRPREPLLVIGYLEQASAKGKYYDALELDKSDSLTIDFTDNSKKQGRDWYETAQGPHPSRDKSEEITSWEAAKIKQLNGENYRETVGATRGSLFSYKFQGNPNGKFKFTPGEFYLMELKYPDDAMRHMEVSISTCHAGMWNNSQSGVGIDSGEKYQNTNKIQVLRWIHVADPGVHSVDIINVQDTRNTTPEPRHAAAKSLIITRIIPPLPAADMGYLRNFGIDCERTSENSGVCKNFGVEIKENNEGTMMARTIRMMRVNQEIAGRYLQYLRFAGQNTHVIGMWQYNDTNTPYQPNNDVIDGRVDPTIRNVLARTLDANNISIFAGIELSQLTNLNTTVTNAQVAVGTKNGQRPENDTVMLVDSKGSQYDANLIQSYSQNWMHPEIQKGFLNLIKNVTGKFDDLTNFKGIHYQLGWAQRSEYYFPGFSERGKPNDPLLFSFDDVTFEKFYQETGINLEVGSSDPNRFMKRYQAVKGEHRPKFTNWRCRQFAKFLSSGLKAMQEIKPETKWVNLLNIEEPDLYEHWLEWKEKYPTDQNSFVALMKEYALDIPLVNAEKHMTIGRSAVGWREMPNLYATGLSIYATQNPFHWLARTDQEVADAFNDSSDDFRYVLIRNSWDENVVVGAGNLTRSGGDGKEILQGDKYWVMERSRIRALPQARGFHAREPFIQSIITSDPNLLFGGFIDLNVNVGHEEDIGPLMVEFTHLPEERFQPVLQTGLETNLAIRKMTKGNKTYFYIANPGYWQFNGTVKISSPKAVTELVSGLTAATPQDGETALKVDLAPYSMKAYYIDDQNVDFKSFSTAPISESEKQHMQEIIDKTGELLTKAKNAGSEEEFVRKQLESARTALGKNEFARAWALLTNWRFWKWKFRAERPGIAIPERKW
ncbi:MAG: hypothetical protein A2X48_12900 [Lentisphaerae bacterium GWF2_49_21]|nr:MAG: hypothetical protein A2X48_12900 [Lentisphaerae bacterium GWF2_49_21]